MLCVIKLQGLNAEAGCDDIRSFFNRLVLPEGTIHVVGGDLAEAFILFTSKRDVKVALRQSGKSLKGSPVTLSVSCAAELKKKLLFGLKQHKGGSKDFPAEIPPALSLEPCQKPDSATNPDASTLLLTLLVALKNMDSGENVTSITDDSTNCHANDLPVRSTSCSPPNVFPSVPMLKGDETIEVKPPNGKVTCYPPGYLFIYGLPRTVRKAEITSFLHGLSVQEVLPNVSVGDCHGCLVRVVSEREVDVGLQCIRPNFGDIPIEVRKATEKQWRHAMTQLQGSPQQVQMVTSTSKTDFATRDKCHDARKRPHSEDPLTKSKAKHKEYCIMVQNLLPNMTKTEIKGLLQCPHLQTSKIQLLLDKNGNRSSTAFVVFDRTDDYISAINLSGSRIGNLVLNVSPITREKMMSELRPYEKNVSQHSTNPLKKRSGSCKTCVYVRNLPADVSHLQVQGIFKKFPVKEKDITLLKDDTGHGLGEAIVSFSSESTASRAYCLNNSYFMENKILLTLITSEQLNAMLN